MPLFWDEEKQAMVPYPTAGAKPVVNAPPGAAPGAAPVPGAAAQPQATGYGMFTPEERDYYMQNMPNITAQGEALSRQHALSDELRKRALPSNRLDWASQASRALSGIGSALSSRQAQKAQDKLTGTQRDFWGGFGKLRDRRDDDDDYL